MVAWGWRLARQRPLEGPGVWLNEGNAVRTSLDLSRTRPPRLFSGDARMGWGGRCGVDGAGRMVWCGQCGVHGAVRTVQGGRCSVDEAQDGVKSRAQSRIRVWASCGRCNKSPQMWRKQPILHGLRGQVHNIKVAAELDFFCRPQERLSFFIVFSSFQRPLRASAHGISLRSLQPLASVFTSPRTNFDLPASLS